MTALHRCMPCNCKRMLAFGMTLCSKVGSRQDTGSSVSGCRVLSGTRVGNVRKCVGKKSMTVVFCVQKRCRTMETPPPQLPDTFPDIPDTFSRQDMTSRHVFLTDPTKKVFPTRHLNFRCRHVVSGTPFLSCLSGCRGHRGQPWFSETS